MIVTSRRAVAAGAWAAVLLALAVTGPQWAFTPWFAAVALLLLAGLGAYALGLLDPHHAAADGSKRGIRTTRREREGRVSDSEKAAQEAWDAMLADYRPLAIEPAPAVEHSANWETRTDVIGSGRIPAFIPDVTPPPFPPGPVTPQVLADRYGPDAFGPGPVVTVTDDPAGRHARPRVHAFEGIRIEECGSCGRQSHPTGMHREWEAMAARTPPRATPAQRADTAPRIGQLPDWVVAITGHESNAAAVESMFTRAMARAIADVEGARR